MGQPILEGAAGEVRGESGDEEGAEVGVLALAEDPPDVGVAQSRKGGDLQLEQVVLGWVEVDGMHAGRTLHEVGEDVITSAGDG